MSMNFTSRFGEDLENMIRLKVSLGGAESTYLDRAQNFDRFCSEKYPDADCLTEPLALSWIKDAGTATGVILSRLAFERGFATYLTSVGKPAYVLPDRFASGRSIFVPYIFTDGELSSLFQEIDSYQYPQEPFRPILLSVYFRLTYTCGLRPNEGRTLKKQNVDLNTGEIQILNTKMQKSRVVVMSDDMCFMARTYSALRDVAFPDSEYFFPSPDGGPYTAKWMQGKFKRFFALANQDIPREFLPPVRVYDLRHRFATAVLNRWLDGKQDIHSRLPYLRTYLSNLITEKGFSPATWNNRLAALKAFIAYASACYPEYIAVSAELSAIKAQKDDPFSKVEYMSEEAVRVLLAEPDTTTRLGLRDRVMLIFFYDTGARIQEVLNVRICDLKLDSTPKVVLHGKGNKVRTVPLMKDTSQHLGHYMAVFHEGEPAASPQFLFYTERKSVRKPVCDDSVRLMMQKYADSARAKCPEIPERVHPHLWRHTRAMHLYQHGMDLTLVSQWLGHANLETTLIYAYADTEHKRQAIARALGDSAAPGVDPANYTVTDEELLKRLYGL